MNITPEYITRLARKIHQMDARFSAKLNRWACLVFAIISISNDRRQRAATEDEIQAIYDRAVKEGAVAGNAMVQNTPWVGNIALDVLGLWNQYTFYELYRTFPDGTVQKIKNLNADPTDRIDEYHVLGAGGHFVHADLNGSLLYDPSPDLPLTSIKSSRFIAVVEK